MCGSGVFCWRWHPVDPRLPSQAGEPNQLVSATCILLGLVAATQIFLGEPSVFGGGQRVPHERATHAVI